MGINAKLVSLTIIESSGSLSRATVTITEGKFHQVKRMFASVGCKVVYLKRLAIGGLELDESLALGEYRELTDKELDCLKAEATH